MEDDGQEEQQPSGCFMATVRSMVTTVRDSIRRRRVRRRRKNCHVAKVHEGKEEAGAEKPKVKKIKRWVINPFRRRRPKDREAAAAAKAIEECSIEECRAEEAIEAPQATEATEGKEEVTSETPAEAAGLQAEACPTAADHDADDAAADDIDDDIEDDGVATATEEARRCCEDVVQSSLLGFDIPEGLITHQTLRHIRETDESNAWDLFVLLSLTVFLGGITFYFFVSLFKIITEDV
ncbi:uncharacterized protein LOC134438220 [Engraulis encrasicolus]|uniref:uncharacterized protein LOC134438220 n=1 Tax=Engraulis encrasicolus TaxID=184585 RepID=UPI002FCF6E67